MTDVYSVAARYGVRYSGTLVDSTYHDQVDYSETLELSEVAEQHGKITRVRVLKDEGRNAPCDVSYIHATLPDGRIVPVRVPVGHCRYGQLRGELIAWAKSEGVYAKALGLFDQDVWSVLG